MARTSHIAGTGLATALPDDPKLSDDKAPASDTKGSPPETPGSSTSSTPWRPAPGTVNAEQDEVFGATGAAAAEAAFVRSMTG